MIVEYMGGMKLVAHHRGFDVVSDQPESGGGENTAMTPTEIFLASLAMCAGVFVLYFAKRHDIPLEGMKIEADWEMAENPRRVGKMEVRVRLPQPVNERHLAALQRAAEQCVVHETLRHAPEIKIVVGSAAPG
jgi:putative redox protein